jgi:DNA-binding beta-propeller fold protein YncE
MTNRTRLLRVLASAAMAACLVLSGGSGVLANGVGDLYVADPTGVQELYLKAARIEQSVPVTPGPSMLAFTPDGKTLYAGDGTASLTEIDIASISVAGSVTLPSAAVAIAHPRGTALFIAYKDQKSLGTLLDGDSKVGSGALLPGTPDILAADRHEARLVAAQAGKPWISIIEPLSAKVQPVGNGVTGIGGNVVAIAVARDEGFAYVATTSPNRVARIRLDTGAVTWNVPLDAAPSAIAAVSGAAVVAIDTRVLKVAAGKLSAFADAGGPVLGLAGNDEGKFAYIATTSAVTAIALADPTAKPASKVALAKGRPAALAPVPRDSSLATSSSGSQASAGASPGGTGPAAARSRPPATDTVGGGPLFVRPGQDLTAVLAAAAAIAVAVLVGSRKVIARLTDQA